MRGTRSAGFAVLLAMVAPVAALAHAKMTTTVPNDGATVPQGLSEIQLDFSKPMRLTLVRLVRTKEQQQVPTKSELPKSFVESAKIAVEALTAGPYEVFWTAVADDGHVMNGSIKFFVGGALSAKPTQ